MKAMLNFCVLLLTTYSIHAQDTLIAKKGDTLLVEVLSIDYEQVRFHPAGKTDVALQADLKVVQAVLFQDKKKHKDFHNAPTELMEEAISDTSRLWVVVTNDGNEFVGYIKENTQEYLRLETVSLGLINIPKANIRKIRAANPNTKIVDGEAWLANPQSTRYFWAPNGYGLKAGEGYYQNIWILFNQFSYGITDHVSIGVGLVPLFLFGGDVPTPIWFTPKFSIPISEDRFNLGGGALIATVIGGGDGGTGVGIAYGVSTLGSRDKNVTLGLGYGFADGGWANSPTITLGGMTRLGKRGYLLTENYFIGTPFDPILILSFGGRVVWPNFSLDFGGFIPSTSDGLEPLVIPWLGFSVPLGK
jgi:hypothetical protein